LAELESGFLFRNAWLFSADYAIRELVGVGSWVVFDYAHASVLRGEGGAYGEKRMAQGVRKFGESWQFGLDEREVKPLLLKYSFRLTDLKSPHALEEKYFRGEDGKAFTRINGTQSMVLAERVVKAASATRPTPKSSRSEEHTSELQSL
jgi:O-methyltransferase involved in polyketide biosynthesis